MKKKLFAMATVLCLVLAIEPFAVFAADATDEATLDTALTAGDEVVLTQDITLTKKLAEIPVGVSVTLNLNGHTLTGAAGQDVLSNKGTLTVVGSGTVKVNGAGAAIVNYSGGNVNLNGGTFTGDAWYTLKNMGIMEITDGVTVNTTNATATASLIDNGWVGNDDRGETAPTDGTTANLTITGGTFTGGAKTTNTVKNDDYSKLNVTGGTFTNVSGTTIANWGEATISGGTFSSAEAHVLANTFLSDPADKGIMTITGGTFSAKDENASLVGYAASAKQGGALNIQGGSFVGKIVADPAQYTYTITVTSGTFSSEVAAAYLAAGTTAALKTSTAAGTAFYVGTADQVAANVAGVQTGDTVTVTQGDLNLTNVAGGVVVANQGTGAVTVNNETVPQNGQVVVHQHAAVKVDAKAPTATEPGNVEYYYCADCGKYFLDAALIQETTADQLVLAATGVVPPTAGEIVEENTGVVAGANANAEASLNAATTGDTGVAVAVLLAVLVGAGAVVVVCMMKKRA